VYSGMHYRKTFIYNVMSTQIPMDDPIETPSADFDNKEEYGAVVYLKTAIWMYIVELTVGREKLDEAVKAYYDKWKFRHPYPEDVKAEFEAKLNMKLDDVFGLLNKKGKFE
jgi:aminopeptidase N